MNHLNQLWKVLALANDQDLTIGFPVSVSVVPVIPFAFLLEAWIPTVVTGPEVVKIIIPVSMPKMGQLATTAYDLYVWDPHLLIPLPRGVGVMVSPLMWREVLPNGLSWWRVVIRILCILSLGFLLFYLIGYLTHQRSLLLT